MIVHSNMLAMIILHWISIHVSSTEIVTVKANRCRVRYTKVIEKLVNAYGLSNCITNSPILSLIGGLRDSGLLLGTSGD